MKKALVTGITGFAGSFLAEQLLDSGYEVYGAHISDNIQNIEFIQDKVQLEKVDLMDFEKVTECIKKVSPDFIFHLAALTTPGDSFKEPAKFMINNITSQMNILESVKNLNISPRILVTSSSEIYGMVKEEELPINEKAEMRPANPYAVSKIAQDYLALQYFLAYKMDIVRIRPFNHIGPRQTDQFVVANFAKQIAEIEKNNLPKVIKVGNLEAKRDFTDVRDMVKAYVLLAEKGAAGDVYNVGSGSSYKISEILSILVSMSSDPITTEEDPARLRPSDVPDIRSDNTKVESETGWKPTIPLATTLKDILDYYRSVV